MRTIEQLEFALFEYLDRWNCRRLHGEIGMIPPVEKEATYYRQRRPVPNESSPYPNPGHFSPYLVQRDR